MFFLDHQSHEDGSYQTLIENAAVLALPSWVEGAPIAALEAASLGTRLALSDRGAVREYFGERAHYCDPANLESIRRAVQGAFEESRRDGSNDEALRRHVGERFTWDRVAEETEAAYLACLEKGTAEPKDLAAPSLFANLPPYPTPCADPAPGRWTKRARQLWPDYLAGRLGREHLVELARIWLSMRQPAAALHLLEENREILGDQATVLAREIGAYHVDESTRAAVDDLAAAEAAIDGTEQTMRENERFHLWSSLVSAGDPAVLAELGSYRGGSTALVAEFLRGRGIDDAAFASVDVAKPEEYWAARTDSPRRPAIGRRRTSVARGRGGRHGGLGPSRRGPSL